jgi:hypothetical protein
MHFRISHLVAHHHPAPQLGARGRAWVWMLIGLMLLATLAPAISRTLEHSKSMAERGWVEVCNAHGLAWVKADGPEPSRLTVPGVQSPLQASLAQQLDACGFCTVGIDRGTPPPDFSHLGLSHPLPSAQPVVPFRVHRSPDGWATLARGPPIRS